jgi:hypothetical protein
VRGRAATSIWLATAAVLAGAGSAQAALPPLPAPCRANSAHIRQADAAAPLVVGDSVTVPAGRYLAQMGFAVEAVACQAWAHGLEILGGRRRLPDTVVVALGSNGTASPEQLNQALELVGPFGRLVLVLPKALGGRPDPDGRLMRAFAEAHPDQVEILDWPAFSAGESGWFAPDGLHLTTAGAQGFAQMIREGVDFSPAEQVDPQPQEPAEKPPPARPGPQEAPPHPALAAVWRRISQTVAALVGPSLHFLGRFVAEPDALGSQDL